MSFTVHARRVRDAGLPLRSRVGSLHSCVQLYHPLGFRATLDRLAAEAGPYRRDEAALLRALEVLQRGRAAWHAELRAFDARRRAAKARGERGLRAGERNPYVDLRWYGPPGGG